MSLYSWPASWPCLQPYVARRFSGIRYLWTVLFFIPGLYLLILGDLESWPTGNQTMYYVITENMQVLQHKIFSLILLALSAVEYLRIRGKLQAVWTAFLFPAFAAAGAALLFFHSPPGSDMDEAAHQTMMQIQHQHVQFGTGGFWNCHLQGDSRHRTIPSAGDADRLRSIDVDSRTAVDELHRIGPVPCQGAAGSSDGGGPHNFLLLESCYQPSGLVPRDSQRGRPRGEVAEWLKAAVC